jgi:hypothetical protein
MLLPARLTRPLFVALAPALALACGSSSTPHSPTEGTGGTSAVNGSPDGGAAPSGSAAEAPAGKACSAGSECGPGLQCLGDGGCDATWTCRAAIPCTRDLRPYCGCDGQTFQASGSCPDKKYSKRGGCYTKPL